MFRAFLELLETIKWNSIFLVRSEYIQIYSQAWRKNAYFSEAQKQLNARQWHEKKIGAHTHPVFLVSSKCTVQILQWDVVVLVEPLHDKRLEPCWIFGHGSLVRWHIFHILFVVVFDLWCKTQTTNDLLVALCERQKKKNVFQVMYNVYFEMQIHIFGWYAEAVLFVFFQCIFHVDSKETPHCRCRQLRNTEDGEGEQNNYNRFKWMAQNWWCIRFGYCHTPLTWPMFSSCGNWLRTVL